MAIKEELYTDFVNNLNRKLYEYYKSDYSDLIFLCIGTDRITGDSFGPLVGYQLIKLFSNLNNSNITVIGNLEDTVCAADVEKKVSDIYKMCKNPYIVAIDAAVSQKEEIGKIVVEAKGIKIGKGLNKREKEVGNLSIKGVVAKDSRMPQINFSFLQNTSLNLVMQLAEITSNGIYDIIKYS